VTASSGFEVGIPHLGLSGALVAPLGTTGRQALVPGTRYLGMYCMAYNFVQVWKSFENGNETTATGE